MPEGQGVGRRRKELSQPPALRATSFQRKEGEVAKTYLPPFNERREKSFSPL